MALAVITASLWVGAGGAAAQQAPTVAPSPDGAIILGDIPAGYTRDQIEGMARSVAEDSSALPADLPDNVREVVLKLASQFRTAGGDL